MWRDTLREDQILAERLDGERVRFSDLKVGDIVRLVAPDGHHEPDDGYFRVCAPPEMADGTLTPQDYGWCVGVEEVDAATVRAGLN